MTAAAQQVRCLTASVAAHRVEQAISELEHGFSLSGDRRVKLYRLHQEAARHFARAATLQDDLDLMEHDLADAHSHAQAAQRYAL